MKMNTVREKAKSIPVSAFVGSITCAPQWAVKMSDDQCKKQEVENTMNTNSERDYLRNRLQEVYHAKRGELQDQFHIYESDAPNSYKELIEWVKKGLYKLDDQAVKRIDNDGCIYGCFDGIIWTGRIEKDPVAYAAADKDLRAFIQYRKDVIMTADAEAGLEALREAEAWVYKPKKH